ncbi:hypothetical protein SAMN05421595_1921 [Austwickia chelonae]|uniref:DUF4350 domain-containing protein n=1 Tax=Austwickia chelonae NBRC 105200 TaxID=1184607 RepID=K6W4P7_9MICO|nr:DUF4350 domain-containing protein [Austwickia chelonae]GAB76787.1 hypothetical protein AUCHE_03_00040 [Austwickia chelonae NBRC 105200]SEW30708.1 hypothetical protein SAMN05421595_1921 [Austwickia chelonae]
MKSMGRPLGAIGIVLAVVAAALIGTYWISGDRIGPEEGNLNSATASGGAALSALLRERAQVDVRMARTSSELGNPHEGTFVIATENKIPAEALGSVRSHASRAKTLVLIAPHQETLDLFARDIRPLTKIDGGSFNARCTAGWIRAADEIDGRSTLYLSNRGDDQVCFKQVGGGTGLPGSLVGREEGGRRLLVVGNPEMFTNNRLDKLGNAAVALRLLSGHPQLTWYSGVTEKRATDGEPGAAATWHPPWFQPMVLGLTATVVVGMFWRGRRFGRLAREPLPVVVQAGETTLARGRMYRRAHEPGYAATILQQATCRRLAATLALAPSADPGAVAQAASRVCRRSPDDILHTLTRVPQNDADLSAIAGALASLEGEVRRT